MAFDGAGILLLCHGLHRCDGGLSSGPRDRPAARQRHLFRGRLQCARRGAVPDRPVFPRRQRRLRGRGRGALALPDRRLRLRRRVHPDQGRRAGPIRLAVRLDLMGRLRRLYRLEYQAGAGGRAFREPLVQSRCERGDGGLRRVPAGLRGQPWWYGGDRRCASAGGGCGAGPQRGRGGGAESRGRRPATLAPGDCRRRAAASAARSLGRAADDPVTSCAAAGFAHRFGRAVADAAVRRADGRTDGVRGGEAGRCRGDGPRLAGGRGPPSHDRGARGTSAGTFSETGGGIARQNPGSCRESISRAEAEGLRYTYQQARCFDRTAPSGRFFSCRTSRARTSII